MTSISDKIAAAANGAQVNRLLPSGLALVHGGRGLWCFTVGGNAQGFHESFADAKARAAKYMLEDAE